MHIPHSRRKEIDPRGNKLLDLVRTSQHALHSHRIRHPVLAALDPARLGLSSDPPRVAVRDQLLRLGQVVSFLVMRHVDHDGVEGQGIGRQAHEFFVLAVVEVDCDGDCGSGGCVCGCADEEAVGGCDGPGEDLDYQGGAVLFCRADDGDDLLEVVAVFLGWVCQMFGRLESGFEVLGFFSFFLTYTMEATTP